MATSEKTLTLLVHQLGRVVHLGGCDGAVVCRHLVVQMGRQQHEKTRRCLSFHLGRRGAINLSEGKNKDVELEGENLTSELHVAAEL